MKYEIVQFINGKFGIRRRFIIEHLLNIGGSYRDFNPTLYYWLKPNNKNFEDCQLETRKEAEDWFLRIKNKYEKI